jgi:hypothetical protein
LTDTATAIEYAGQAAEATEELVAKEEEKNPTMSCEYLELYHTSLVYFLSQSPDSTPISFDLKDTVQQILQLTA